MCNMHNQITCGKKNEKEKEKMTKMNTWYILTVVNSERQGRWDSDRELGKEIASGREGLRGRDGDV